MTRLDRSGYLLFVVCLFAFHSAFAGPTDGEPCLPKRDAMNLLPADLLRIIYKNLDEDSKKSVSQVTKRQRALILNEFLKSKAIDISANQIQAQLTGVQIESYLSTIPDSVASKIEEMNLSGHEKLNDDWAPSWVAEKSVFLSC